MPKVFVYGAQMVHPESVGAWPGLVRDHAVRFIARGVPVFEPVFAALVPAPDELAHGLIVDFSPESWASLVALERSYEARELEVELLDPDDASALGGPTLRCQAFILVKQHTKPGRPSARYARKLAAGARGHGLPAEVIARYERAADEGSRLSLALAWLFPLASRIGLVPTAILILVVLPTLAALGTLWALG